MTLRIGGVERSLNVAFGGACERNALFFNRFDGKVYLGDETRGALVAAQADTFAILQARVREADPPAIPFEFEAPE